MQNKTCMGCSRKVEKNEIFFSPYLTEEYPNYWGDMPMAVYTFLEHFDWNGKVIHPFCTHEGSGLSGTEGKIRNACKGATVTGGLAIQGSSVDHARSNVEKWV